MLTIHVPRVKTHIVDYCMQIKTIYYPLEKRIKDYISGIKCGVYNNEPFNAECSEVHYADSCITNANKLHIYG